MFTPAEYGLQQESKRPPPPSHTLSVYDVLSLSEGGGEDEPGRRLEGQQIVHKAGSKYQT
jgi:hypothetical protein